MPKRTPLERTPRERAVSSPPGKGGDLGIRDPRAADGAPHKATLHRIVSHQLLRGRGGILNLEQMGQCISDNADKNSRKI